MEKLKFSESGKEVYNFDERKYIMKKSKQINQKDLKKIRAFFHKKQDEICPILKMKFPIEDMVCDHQHHKNSINLGKPEEAGLIRGIIQRQANSIEGRISGAFIRMGLHKFDITLPEFLRNLADFIENPPLTHLKYIHPSEKPKPKRLKKNYPNRKIPSCFVYNTQDRRGKKLTKTIEKFYKEFELKPSFLKK